MRKPNQDQLQKIVNDFNAKYPVGTKVVLRKDSGEVETAVTAPARILSGHSAVAWFEGVSGAYSIDGRVRSLPRLWLSEFLELPERQAKSEE
jgi:hypothetical protein